MEQLNLPDKFKRNIRNFIQLLKDIYKEGLVSIIFYGSAVSGEFVDKHSNLNLLVVLNNTDLENLEKASGLINKFKMINPLFLTQDYIKSSTDIFPIEFLDMQENYLVLYGKDILKEINIDIRNLRFQCEQEIKAKLINLRQAYLRMGRDSLALRKLLFKSFGSSLHILRNILRLKGRKPPYLKQEILKELVSLLGIDRNIWEKILLSKSKQVRLSSKETRGLFIAFVRELEKIAEVVDKL